MFYFSKMIRSVAFSFESYVNAMFVLKWCFIITDIFMIKKHNCILWKHVIQTNLPWICKIRIFAIVIKSILYGLCHIPYSLDYSPGLIRVLTRIQSRKFELLFNKKWQKLEYNPIQKMKKINSVPDCNPDLTVYLTIPWQAAFVTICTTSTIYFRREILSSNHY